MRLSLFLSQSKSYYLTFKEELILMDSMVKIVTHLIIVRFAASILNWDSE